MAMSEAEIKAYAQQLFEKVDANKNGAIDREEFRSFCRKHEQDMTED